MPVCAKMQKNEYSIERSKLGGSRYVCSKEVDHPGECGLWMNITQHEHVYLEALADRARGWKEQLQIGVKAT